MDSLQTRRLRLVPLARAHAPAMFELLRDPALYRHLDESPPVSAQALAERYGRLEARRSPDGRQHWLNWVLLPLEGDAPLGYVQATVEPTERRAWVAYVLGSAHQGKGHAREAVGEMLQHLRSHWDVACCLATVEAANERSIRLLQALGFRAATPAEAAGHGLSASERLFLR
jgi:RimJ/RimL family protein N-acetyltransferase